MPTPWIYPSDRTILRYRFVPSLHHDLTRDEQVGKKGIIVEGPKATGPSCTKLFAARSYVERFYPIDRSGRSLLQTLGKIDLVEASNALAA